MTGGAGALSNYLRRSWKYTVDTCKEAVKMDVSWKKEMPMFDLNSADALQQWTVGCDADVGGLSEAYWGLTPQRTGRFILRKAYLWGTLSTDIPKDSKLSLSGYAGVRSKERPVTMLHRPRFDVSDFRYLAIRAKGDVRQWFVNLQCDSLYPSYLWQHRLSFQNPGEWETIMIPFRDFVLTAHGFVQKKQLEFDKATLKTVGFSVVRQPGDFGLEVKWVKAVNTSDTFGELDLSQLPAATLSEQFKIMAKQIKQAKLLPDKNDSSFF